MLFKITIVKTLRFRYNRVWHYGQGDSDFERGGENLAEKQKSKMSVLSDDGSVIFDFYSSDRM